ncbi:diacylglycerol kinase family protein [uncultured Sphingomonas sp.]|uniref:diacylglycerol/lipid kinase family protein n=1 Tax=uncultured Sphingomonas sp. TaxID=158754 RepID=UPI0030D98413
MTRFWLIANARSGSVSDTTREGVVAALESRGALAGRTDFPTEPLPEPRDLTAAGVDTVAVLAGDGTINAAARRYADWPGALLILPGGTMNLLARALHGDAAPVAIVEQLDQARAVDLPVIVAAEHRAFVGVILGPATAWNRARERWRAGRWRAALRAVRAAWQRSRGRGIAIEGVAGRPQAVFVSGGEQELHVAAVDASDGRMLAELGWEWLTGDWIAAGAVTSIARPTVRLGGRRPVAALFDGEPALLPAGSVLRLERSRPMFLQTRPILLQTRKPAA